MKESFAFQRSRIKRLQQGDSNSPFFHSWVNKRRRDNGINGLHLRGSWREDPEEIKEGIFQHFKDFFKQKVLDRPNLDGVHFNKISSQESDLLTGVFSIEEIKDAVWGCEGNKSPGVIILLSSRNSGM